MGNLIPFLGLLLCGLIMASQAQQEVLLTLPTLGTIKGRSMMTFGNLDHQSKNFFQFRNIPFAESVSGDKRFSQPVQLRTELGTLESPYDATKSGPLCPQLGLNETVIENLNTKVIDDVVHGVLVQYHLDGLIETDIVLTILEDLMEVPFKGETFEDVIHSLLDVDLSVSEDCLHLAVSTPRLNEDGSDDNLLPVMFFIYGGGFTAGTQMKMNYDRLGDVNDVVLVAINYRLGPLGFMCLDTESAAGNMGLLDQIVGLEWVQENIKYFGGDPNQVTIFGESAGAVSVSFLTISPLAEGLFHQAIGESGAALAAWAYDDVNPEIHARNIAAKVGCTQDDLEELVECLKTVDYVELTLADDEYAHQEEASGKGLGFGGHCPCGQTKGPRIVIEHGTDPNEVFTSGNYNPVKMFFGANWDEGLLPYAIVDTNTFNDTLKNDADWLTNEMVPFFFEVCGYSVDQETCNQIRDEYWTPEQLGDYEAMQPGTIDLMGVITLKEPQLQVIEKNSKFADSFFYTLESRGQKSFHRIFNQLGSPELSEPEFPDGYCTHGDDLQFLFKLDIPIVLCDLEEFFTGLVNAFLRCAISHPLHPEQCVVEENSQFRQQYGECLHSELLDSELLTSDAMVKAWTNFAIYGTPTPQGSGLPTLAPWSESNPNYIAFKPETEVRTNFRDAYHSTPQVVKDILKNLPKK